MTKTNELKALMLKRGLKNADMAEALGISTYTFSLKLNNKREYKASEIKIIQSILDVDNTTRDEIFFN